MTLQRSNGSKVIRDGKGKTDAQGRFSFDVPANVSEYPQSQTFELEAEITDLSNQAVAGRVSVVVHSGRFYIGLRPQRYVGTVGEEQGVDVITLDTKGITVTNQAVDLQVFRREWFSAREKQADGSFLWRSAFTDTLITTLNVEYREYRRGRRSIHAGCRRHLPRAGPRDRRRGQPGSERHLPLGGRQRLCQLADGGPRPHRPHRRQEAVRAG